MPQNEPTRRPNVVFVLTDDQGYGDLACHGNPVIRTPHLDRMHDDSVRLTDYHVGPTCSPTRAGLMAGRYCNCTGVWHTIGGRSLIRRDEVTMADVFSAHGYRTGMFGKWHLGDNYPFRPQDRGFDDVLTHGDGVVGSTPDYWGNDYFDDTYYRGDRPEHCPGYCTDVWFAEALRFIEANRDRPFFCYLPTNAPHYPYHVPESYSEPYCATEPERRANFYGMITCIDENFGRLRARLGELGIERDTILIFMTDNGSSGGCELDDRSFVVDGYNAHMRGRKGSEYEGGHRVPFFLRWPGGGLDTGRDVNQLTANIDILPTLMDLCGLDSANRSRLHGTSLAPLLRGDADDWPERVIVTDSQRVEHPVKWKQSATMTGRWRLVNGTELYDVHADGEQRNDLAADQPDLVRRLRLEYEKWWDIVSARFNDEPAVILGSAREPASVLTSHDWHGENHAWSQGRVRAGLVCNGHWSVEIAEAGEYEFELRRWPREEPTAMTAGFPGEITWYTGGRAIDLRSARITVGEAQQSCDVPADASCVTFRLTLPAGRTRLKTALTAADGTSLGAYYVYVRRKNGS